MPICYCNYCGGQDPIPFHRCNIGRHLKRYGSLPPALKRAAQIANGELPAEEVDEADENLDEPDPGFVDPVLQVRPHDPMCMYVPITSDCMLRRDPGIHALGCNAEYYNYTYTIVIVFLLLLVRISRGGGGGGGSTYNKSMVSAGWVLVKPSFCQFVTV
jgi:hypothetical protein